MQALTPVTRALARWYPADVTASDELADSLEFIESSIEPETIVKAGYTAGALSMPLLVPLVFTPLQWYVIPVVMLAVALGVIHSVHTAPHVLAALRRTEALGDTPNLIGRAVLRMGIQPSTENAVRFAADTGQGPLASSLSSHIDRAMGTPRSGLLTFAEEWAEWFPALRRSSYLLSTAQDAPAGERTRTLDRSLAAILHGTRDQMAEFTSAIRGPTTALYAFGILLPLALVALVPAAAIVEYPVDTWVFIAVYNVLLPLVIVVASVWLLVRRPVAFPPPSVPHDHPDIPDQLWLRLTWGLAAGVVASVLTALLGPPYLAPVAAMGMGLGVTLLALFRPVMVVRNYVRDVEEHLVDALYLVGRQVTEGRAVEASIELAADRVPGETGDVFEAASGVQRRLHIGVQEAFLGDYGALRDVPSARAQGMARLLAIAAEEGRPAGRAIVEMADHLEELQEVECETRRQLTMVTGTLENTASYFGPLIAGSTVALAGLMAEHVIDDEAIAQEMLAVDSLGIVVGVYVLTLCLLLTPLSLALRHGLDRALIGYNVGRSLVFATPIYVVTVGLVELLI
ncbi:secretion system protein [Natrialbaceae archaeon A-CW2]|uniref:secretion system protein n=1 Tax=Natronosalvus amylolyticus TaxID=2961994 RepID=UPI0020C97145|nr:secretion system protein [Natronosalvus amylolyticus]